VDVTAAEAAPVAPPPVDADYGGDDGGDDGGPWWHSPWRLLVLAVALLFLGGAGGFFVANRSDAPGARSIDVGFLQDMRWHHDQATQMALAYMGKPAAGQDPALRTIAAEILLEQQLEAGAMVQLLHDYGQPEQNESGIGMAWMGMPVPIDAMPGMASADQLAQFRTATGKDADRELITLMIAHHQGGIDMADYAAARAQESRVRELARNMASGQREEIAELQTIQARLG
jgi:uncharacterized protein (DUF305 family)